MRYRVRQKVRDKKNHQKFQRKKKKVTEQHKQTESKTVRNGERYRGRMAD